MVILRKFILLLRKGVYPYEYKLSTTGIALQASLKKTEMKLQLLTDFDVI